MFLFSPLCVPQLCWVLSINLLHPLAKPLLLPLAPLLQSLGL